MDNQRILLASAISLVIVMAWSYFFAPQQVPQQQNQTVATAPAAQPAQAPAAMPAPDLSNFLPAQGETISVDTPLYTAKIAADGGIVKSFELKKYRETIKPNSANINLIDGASVLKAPMGILFNGRPTWTEGQWSLEGSDLTLGGGENGTIRLVCHISGMKLIRELTFTADNYLISEKLGIVNTTTAQAAAKVGFTLASKALSLEDDRYNQTRLAFYSAEGGLDQETDRDDAREGFVSEGGVLWGGLESNYFLMAIAPEVGTNIFKSRLEDTTFRMAVDVNDLIVDPGSQISVGAHYYMGPKEQSTLDMAPNELKEAIDFGFFSFIAKPLLWCLNKLYEYVGNYGVAIILLTIGTKIILWPLSQKSYESMNKMKKLQPKMAKLREKYGEDREKLNQEMMQLYKTYKVNPAGGCVPMLLQIPVFLGLYQALLGAIELRHAPFIAHVPFTDMVWLADLSAKDPYYVTPLIMGATMFLQQRMSPPPGDPTQAKVMMFMPVIFTFIFLNFPSGLVIYWLVNNVLSIGQQWMLSREA